MEADDGTRLHVGVCGSGADVLILSGGPGCVHYLEHDHLVPPGMRAFFPEPRGVGRSAGGAHDMARAVADLESVRMASGVERWTVLGHSWGGDLAVRYALDSPSTVARVVAIAGHGLHKDRTWSEEYERGKAQEPQPEIPWSPHVWQALSESFVEWIHRPHLFRDLADTPIPMHIIAAGDDIRPSWPLQQLAALVPHGTFENIPGVPHDFWLTHPEIWTALVARTCLDAP